MAFIYSMTFNDAFNGVATRQFALVAADFAAAKLIADAILAAAQGLTTAAIVRDALSDTSEIVAIADVSSNVDGGLTWQFSTGPGRTGSINFPSPVMSVVNSDRSVDLADPLVAALMTIYTDGDITVSDGELVAFVIKGQLDK